MFQAKPAIVFMALAIFCSRVSAQSLHENGLDTSASVTVPELYEPIDNTVFSSSSARDTASLANHSVRSTSGMIPPSTYPDKLHVHPFSKLALGFKADTLGAGVELAAPISRRLNLRAAANTFNFRYLFNIDGIDYDAQLHFHSGQLAVDWFPFHGEFHISPGVLYFQNTLTAKASVSAGQPFQLANTSYTNSVDDPIYGTADITYSRKIAPTITVGVGNLIPRTGRHISVPFEVGIAYLGAAKMNIKLAGTTCTTTGCFNAATDPETQSSLQQEVQDLNGELVKYKLYPIVSLGFGYRF